GPEPLELCELAVELEHRLGHGVVGKGAEYVPGNAPQRGSERRDQGVAIGALRARERHRQEQHVRRYEEERALDEGNDRPPDLRGLARGKRQRPVVKASKHAACLAREVRAVERQVVMGGLEGYPLTPARAPAAPAGTSGGGGA